MTQQSVERLCFATSPAVKTFSSSKFVDFFSLAEEDRRRTDEEEEVEGIVASGLHIPKVGGGGEHEEERERERDLTREPQREREIFLSLFFFFCAVFCPVRSTKAQRVCSREDEKC